jgi:hypothetical protein
VFLEVGNRVTDEVTLPSGQILMVSIREDLNTMPRVVRLVNAIAVPRSERDIVRGLEPEPGITRQVVKRWEWRASAGDDVSSGSLDAKFVGGKVRVELTEGMVGEAGPGSVGLESRELREELSAEDDAVADTGTDRNFGHVDGESDHDME